MFPRPTIAVNEVPTTTTEGHKDMKVTEEGSAPPPWTYDRKPYNYEAPKTKVRVTDLVVGSPAVVTYPSTMFPTEKVVGWGGEVVREIAKGHSGGFSETGSVRIGNIDLPFRKSDEGYVLTTETLLGQLAELVNKEIDDKVRAAFEEGFAAASVPVLAEGQL
jgi:hypothetical protein